MSNSHDLSMAMNSLLSFFIPISLRNCSPRRQTERCTCCGIRLWCNTQQSRNDSIRVLHTILECYNSPM
ncbi:hypothetical protein M758_12G127400 [Ceratodon purpureus]|nr:hypothetical protein M758_12G127400 [Ceratodon purpureus]